VSRTARSCLGPVYQTAALVPLTGHHYGRDRVNHDDQLEECEKPLDMRFFYRVATPAIQKKPGENPENAPLRLHSLWTTSAMLVRDGLSVRKCPLHLGGGRRVSTRGHSQRGLGLPPRRLLHRVADEPATSHRLRLGSDRFLTFRFCHLLTVEREPTHSRLCSAISGRPPALLRRTGSARDGGVPSHCIVRAAGESHRD